MYRKYKNVKTVIDGIKFDSKKESERYIVLKMLESKGLIKDLILQPSFEICPAVVFNGKKQRARKYIADFQYYDTVYKTTFVEDVKGFKTDIYKLKRQLFLSQYPQYRFIET